MTQVTILAPRVRSAATRIGPNLWKRLVLPVGTVEHGGKTFTFTADYLAGIAESFRQGAYDYTPLQLSGGLDVEDYGGRVLDLEVTSDGLLAVIEATPAGERVLSQPLSFRITESYERSDGEFFPFALQSVTAGQAISLSNPAPCVYIDMSNTGWQTGEPSGFTDQELRDMIDAAAEADDEIDLDQVVTGSLPYGYRPADLGLSNALGTFSRTLEFAQQQQAAAVAEAARISAWP